MQSKSQKVALALLLGNIFITFVGISLVIPVLPSLMNELSLSGTVVGNMVAAFALAQLIASPITGKWTDQYGRKIMIIIGLFYLVFQSCYLVLLRALRFFSYQEF